MISSRRRIAAALVLALALPAPVLAAEPAAGGSATEQAKSHYKQGKAYQEAGAYDQAIAEYLEADRLAPRPELFFNVAQCHRLAGHAKEAIVYYRKFVTAMPNAPGADESRTYIAQLEQQVQQAEKERAAREKAAREKAAREKAAREKARPEAKTPAVLPPPATEPREQGRPALRWMGAGAVVAGAALIGTGAYFGSRAADEGDQLGGFAGTWTPALAAREDAAQDDDTRMLILVSGGSALLVGGALLWWWGGKPARVEAAPDVAKDRAGLVLRGRF